MFALALRGLRARKLRAVLTALAIFFGVAMVAGTLMLTDTINSSFDDIFQSANERRGRDGQARPRRWRIRRGGEPPAFDADLLQRVLSVPGVAEAAGVINDPSIAILDENGDRIGPMGPAALRRQHGAGALQRMDLRERAATRRTGRGRDRHLHRQGGGASRLGESVRIAGPGGVKRYRIVGIARFGNGEPLGGASFALFTLSEAQRLTGKQGKYDEIADRRRGRARRRPSSRQRVRQGAARLRHGQDRRRRRPRRSRRTSRTASASSRPRCWRSPGIALFVGAFLIFNTFSITVSQRTQEFGMLRTLGAFKRQVLATVVRRGAFHRTDRVGARPDRRPRLRGADHRACSRRSASSCRRATSSSPAAP